VVAAASDTAAGRELQALLKGREPMDQVAIMKGLEWLDATGAEETTVELARTELDRAFVALDGATLERDAQDELRALASFVVERQF